MWSSFLIPTIWRRKKKIAIKFTVIFFIFTVIFIAASILLVLTLTVLSLPDHQLRVVPSLHLGSDPSPSPQPICCQKALSQDTFSHLLDSRFYGSVNHVGF